MSEENKQEPKIDEFDLELDGEPIKEDDDPGSGGEPEVKKEEPKVEKVVVDKDLEEPEDTTDYKALAIARGKKLLELDPFALDEGEPELKVEPKKEESKTEPTVDDPELTDEEFEAMLDNKTKFLAWQKKRETKIIEETLKSTVKIQESRARLEAQAQRELDSFFTKNPDFVEHREHVETVAIGIKQRQPGLTPTQCLEEAGKRVRPLLRQLKKPAGFTPAGGGGSGRQEVKTPTKLQNDINALLDV